MIEITSNTKLTVETSSIVEINKIRQLRGYINIDIPYKIVCDFSEIPPEKHSVVLMTLMQL